MRRSGRWRLGDVGGTRVIREIWGGETGAECWGRRNRRKQVGGGEGVWTGEVK